MSKADDLTVLFPNKDFILGDETLVVRPFSFGDFPKVIKLIADFAELFMNAPELKASVEDGNIAIDGKTVEFIVELLEKGGDNVFSMISLSSGLDMQEVKALDPATGIELAYMVYEVNRDFFTKRLLPVVQKLMPKATPKVEPKQKANKRIGAR